jgi:hypothetical protein
MHVPSVERAVLSQPREESLNAGSLAQGREAAKTKKRFGIPRRAMGRRGFAIARGSKHSAQRLSRSGYPRNANAVMISSPVTPTIIRHANDGASAQAVARMNGPFRTEPCGLG